MYDTAFTIYKCNYYLFRLKVRAPLARDVIYFRSEGKVQLMQRNNYCQQMPTIGIKRNNKEDNNTRRALKNTLNTVLLKILKR